MELAEVFAKIVNQNIRIGLHYAVVTAIENSGGIYYLTIELAGSTTPITKVRYLRSYIPRIGDTVVVQVNKSDIFVIDSLAEAGRSLNPVAFRTTNQTITTGTETIISFDTVQNDTWNCWDLSPNPTRLTAPIPGRYMAVGIIVFAAASSGHRSVTILKNNTEEIAQQDFLPVSASIESHATVTSHAETLATGDYIELRAWHNRGSDLDVVATADHAPTLCLIYLGP